MDSNHRIYCDPLPSGASSYCYQCNLGKALINHQYSIGLYNPFMVKLGLVYYCFTNIVYHTMTGVRDTGPMMKQTKIFRYHPSPDAFTFDLCPKVLAPNGFCSHFCSDQSFQASLVFKQAFEHRNPKSIWVLSISQCSKNTLFAIASSSMAASLALLAAHASVPQLSVAGSQWQSRANSA